MYIYIYIYIYIIYTYSMYDMYIYIYMHSNRHRAICISVHKASIEMMFWFTTFSVYLLCSTYMCTTYSQCICGISVITVVLAGKIWDHRAESISFCDNHQHISVRQTSQERGLLTNPTLGI